MIFYIHNYSNTKHTPPDYQEKIYNAIKVDTFHPLVSRRYEK